MAQEFLPFATDPDARVITQSAYVAAAFRELGFSSGIAVAEQLNKVWRQASFVSSALAEYIATQTGEDVLDNGNMNAFIVQLSKAITTGANIKPADTFTASVDINLTLSDYAIGLARTVSVSAMNVNLPSDANVGQEFVVEDLQGNFSAFPVTVVAPVGQNIAQLPSFVMNINRQSCRFRYYGNNAWSVA